MLCIMYRRPFVWKIWIVMHVVTNFCFLGFYRMCICRPHALQPWLTWHLMPIILVHMLHRGLSVSSTCFLESMQLIPRPCDFSYFIFVLYRTMLILDPIELTMIFFNNRYNKLSDLTGDKLQSIKISLTGEDDSVSEDLVKHS